MTKIKFKNQTHEKKFYHYCNILPQHKQNPEGYAVAYLLALIGEHENDIFDFKHAVIKPDGIHEAWQTGTTKRATSLLFTLWNGYFADPEKGNLYDIFGYSEWDRYFLEAIRIRYFQTIG